MVKKSGRRLLQKELFVACHVSSWWMIILLWTDDDDDFDEQKRGNCNECYLVITTVFNSTTYRESKPLFDCCCWVQSVNHGISACISSSLLELILLLFIQTGFFSVYIHSVRKAQRAVYVHILTLSLRQSARPKFANVSSILLFSVFFSISIILVSIFNLTYLPVVKGIHSTTRLINIGGHPLLLCYFVRICIVTKVPLPTPK